MNSKLIGWDGWPHTPSAFENEVIRSSKREELGCSRAVLKWPGAGCALQRNALQFLLFSRLLKWSPTPSSNHGVLRTPEF